MSDSNQALAESLFASVEAFLASKLAAFEKKLAALTGSIDALAARLTVAESASADIPLEAERQAKLAVYGLRSELDGVASQGQLLMTELRATVAGQLTVLTESVDKRIAEAVAAAEPATVDDVKLLVDAAIPVELSCREDSLIEKILMRMPPPAKGEKGEPGAKGEKGDPGEKGAQGEKGEKGERGETGAAGPQGLPGDSGARGEAGAMGPQGETGAKGEQGEPGIKGETGEKGDPGERGERGLQGDRGADAEPVDYQRIFAQLNEVADGIRKTLVEHCNVLIEKEIREIPIPEPAKIDYDYLREFCRTVHAELIKEVPMPAAPAVEYEKVLPPLMDFLKGVVDDAVALIPVPADGKDGAPGKDGESVALPTILAALQDKLEVMVEEEVKSIEVVVPDPVPGKDGKSVDMAEVQSMVAKAVLEIPERKVFDYAAAKDLVDIAVKAAVSALPPPVAGKDGLSVDDFDVALAEDQRTLVFALRKSNGEYRSHEVTLPVLIARGAYEEGKKYAQGDVVVADGSAWVAQYETSDKPATTGAWKLLAQRGRAGKDAGSKEVVSSQRLSLK